MKQSLLLLISLILLPVISYSQTTGATIEGIVRDAQGQPLAGANVVAIHEPTGTRYGTSTRANGQYTLQGVRVGGPYTIQVTFVGYNAKKKELTQIKLGETLQVNFELEQGNVELEEITVTAQVNPIFSDESSGASTNISTEEIARTPTLSRSLQDYIRLTPQATGSYSFGGANDRYNSLLIDGATLDDVFGLGEATPGSQAGVGSPISIDAIAEFNVALAPFGVTNSGFTGAQINAITRSGTNEFNGSVYYTTRNEALTGNFVQENGELSSDLQEFQERFIGLRVGGPIIKDELFFFVSAEIKRESSPITTGILNSGAPNVFPYSASQFERISQIAQNQYNYNAGGFRSPLEQSQDNNKVLAKLNWNINPDNKFMLRYNYMGAEDEEGISRSEFNYSYENRQYIFNSTLNSIVAELNSTISNNVFNVARVVYTRIRDERNVVDAPFPQVELSLGIQDEFRSIYMGIDRFSQANQLYQDLIEITDNITYIRGDHEFTFGTSNKIFFFNNLFVQDASGTYEFRSIQDFADGDPFSYQYSYLLPGGNPRAKFSGLQFGLYAQDQWTVTERLTLTFGLRADMPVLPEEPSFNPNVPQAFPGYTTSQVASGNILWSPRFGFNWDLSSDETITQIRGGIGIFSGPPPFVWISNQYSNTGVDYGRVDLNDFETDALDDGFFSPNPNDQPSPLDPNSPISAVSTTAVNLISEDFKYPQSLKINLAIDQELPYGITGTLEGIYSNAINAVVFRNLNVVQTGTSIHGRPIYGDVFLNEDFGNASGETALKSENFTNAILLENTQKGYRYNISAQLQKQFYSGLYVNLSYTYNIAKSVNSGNSSRAISNWQFNETLDPNNPRLGITDYNRRHRFLANVGYQFNYLDGFATTISLIYDGHSGVPFSWVYNGNANADTRFDNDLVYVPASPDEIILDSNNWDALNTFINNHPSLDEYRGEFVPRNTATTPWEHFLDLQITQKIPTFEGQSLELTASLFNVLNFINEEWGKREFVSFNNYRVWTLKEYNANGKPIISFDPSRVTEESIYSTSDISSRWRAQLGIRYNF